MTTTARKRGRPRVMEACAPINVRIRPDQMAYLDGLAAEWRVTKSSALRTLLDGVMECMKEEPSHV